MSCIYWLKRDFRLHDNPALTAALTEHQRVLPLFVLEPSALLAPETSELHVHAQCDAYSGLHRDLARHGGELCFAQAEVVSLLEALYAAAPFTHLVSHQETGGNRTYDRDRAVADWCRHRSVNWTEHLQTGVFRGSVDRDRRHRAWERFTKSPLLPAPGGLERCGPTPAQRAVLDRYPARPVAVTDWRRAPTEDFAPAAPPPHAEVWLPDPALLGSRAPAVLRPSDFGFRLSPAQEAHVQPVNEAAARDTLASFMHERALDYSKGMSSPSSAFYRCSRLSVHLAWGSLSLRTAYQTVDAYVGELRDRSGGDAGAEKRAKTLARNLRSFLSRLHWHDHFTQRLETEVEMEYRPLNPNFWELKLEDDPAKLDAWITGRTGYPMVDACIRCLHVTGYVNFRMRAMLTSVATHTLHLDFRSIDKPMARLYTDYEPGIHLAQLQMQAGTVGINTLRAYSPEKQFTDHDPAAHFVHRWVPELRPYSAREIADRDLGQGLGDYPAAVVSDRTERVRTYKKLLGDLKFRPGGREITERVFAKHGSRRGPRRRKSAPAKTTRE